MAYQICGLSLSFCVRDILAGRVLASDISLILSGTRMDSPKEAVDTYGSIYWMDYDPDEVISVVRDLWPRVIQTRTHGLPSHSLADGCWIIREDGDALVMVKLNFGFYRWLYTSDPDRSNVLAEVVNGRLDIKR